MEGLRRITLTLSGMALGIGSILGSPLEAQSADRPCTRMVYPDFLALPPGPAIENTPVADPSGIGQRWSTLIQTALRPSPKDFSWFLEYGTWVCRYQQTDQVVWRSFPPEANADHIAGILVHGRLLIAPVADLVKQGMARQDLRAFDLDDLALAERTRHPVAPAP